MQELTIKQKLTNYYYFVIFNSILACIIGVGYWFNRLKMLYSQALTNWMDILYIITTHFVIITLTVFAVSLTISPTIYLKHKKSALIQLLLFGLLLVILICDIRVFQCDETHVFSVTIHTLIEILTSKQAMCTVNKTIAYVGIIVLLWIIYKISQWINKTNFLVNNKIATKFTSLLLTSCVISLLTYQLNTKEKQQQLLDYVQYLPIINNNNAIARAYEQVKHGKLQYPRKSLQTTAVTNPPNILIIAMDAWRADCFNEIDSPNLWQFAKQGIIFNNHFSGGNHTRYGLFSLFYGIPSNYYNSFKQYKISALLFSRLKQLNYQINCFVEKQKDKWLKFFTDIKNMYKINKNIIRSSKIDKHLTQNWLNWHASLDKTKPWFSFVFYDSLHGPDFPEDYSISAKPAIGLRDYKEFANKVGKQGFINSYKTSVHYVDSLANQILDQLKKSNDLENTIVIITADHGCEWNDNNQGQWGYWSNFTDCQVKVPLAIILPKQYQDQLKHKQDNLTTHYDIVPTLMKNFLGVTNNIADYSIGNDLLNNKEIQEWCLACSSARYGSCFSAIIANNKVLKVSPSGVINNIDNLNHLMFNKTMNIKYLNQALECITRFVK